MHYENNWQSLNSREVPQWFEDAKFGIFIHWGLYSVPAYAPKGCYSEWYAYHCDRETDNDMRYRDFHVKHYGKNFKYNDFVPMFTAENFDAKEWVQLFEDAGAKYMNLVSKHHDGYCLYQSDYAWNWNSVDTGPHRDFCRELADACESSDVKFGVYHSLYEWFHPLYLKNPEEYAVKHLIPMLKELIEKYRPHTLFADGEWEQPCSVWHSTEFLQWLYNESSVKDFIVPNDRWGSETRGRLGGNLTTEYGRTGVEDDSMLLKGRISEECRGIGASFGWNRFETSDDYMTAEALICMLVDLVSRGSNFLLNIGPEPDGRIPVIMQERLRQMGKWLKVNGEGIYCSRKYKDSSDENIKYTKNGDTVYAFLKHFPFDSVTLNEVPYKENTKVTMLGYTGELKTENINGKLKVDFGFISPERINSEYVYTLKI